MNILVKTAGGRVVVRPDITWEKNSDDVYLPDFVEAVSWSPVLYLRVLRPGRSIAPRFAERYYDAAGGGVLLFADNLMDGSEEGYCCASCLDHTSLMPLDMREVSVLDGESEYVLKADGDEIFRRDGFTKAMADELIAEVSTHCYLRTGDLVALELQPRRPLLTREQGECHLSGSLAGCTPLDQRVVL